MAIKIALAGNPNCGKTTMFNELTGSSQYVGNWPGVTVEKKEGKLKGHKDVIIMDLPGIYSLSPYTLEEVVTRNYLLNDRPDVIINLVDASNIERNLYLTTQLVEIGIPVVIALNMIDIVRKNGDKINLEKLSKELGCEVYETSALKGSGLKEVTDKAIALAKSKAKTIPQHTFDNVVENSLAQIEVAVDSIISNKEQSRWYAIKIFERDEKVLGQLTIDSSIKQKVEEIIVACEADMDDDSESIITNERYIYIGKIIKKCLNKKQVGMTTSDKIDRIVTNRWLALPIFVVVMFIVYFVSVSWLGTIVTDWTNDTLFGAWIQPGVGDFLANVGAAEWLQSLVVDGIIGGVGAVLGFVPQMMILFFFLSILEDCGYMARVAFIMDRIFRKFGLSGKSFIPMLIASGCGVPGVMASRTIEQDKDRKMTIMTTTFIPCGAKLPIIALIAGAMFAEKSWWVAPSAYFLGIAMVLFSGIVLKKTRLFLGDPAPFVMELPQYHVPGAKGVLIHMWERGKAFIIKAGTIIFVACGVIWFLSSFGWNLQMAEEGDSILASIGNVIAPIFAPLGFGNWKAAVATVTGLVAKENVVGTFGVLFGISEAAEDDPALLAQVATMFTVISAYAFMAFNLLCAPCFAAIGAIKREMGGWKWTLIAVGYQTALAYAVALIIFQLGGLVTGAVSFGPGTIAALLVLGFMLWMLFRPYKPVKKEKVLSAGGQVNV
ncbi:ferrous iron transport protein B [Ruminiclostridium cellobioparum]|uniref:Ferrous iron transport protein B n=1 Tax=Ruminiclostridium cellobioparum subsp. termitidis CT1112 TaxID=1195236 RepID=S0FFS5_RUMCE|nr:ferrous iron transport protein B [Ruminiclostridium cellobioparum]EMS69925.1 ferrous iron transporter FeoB [Ruminiclostridium cellobioparum subsp. termitidis CT1112]